MSDRRVLVFGSRRPRETPREREVYDMAKGLTEALVSRHVREGDTLVEGECEDSPDVWSRNWARTWVGCDIDPHPADWRPGGRFDRAAGHKRNRRMGATMHPGDLAIGIWDGASGGTKGMAQICRNRGVELRLYVLKLYAVPTEGQG